MRISAISFDFWGTLYDHSGTAAHRAAVRDTTLDEILVERMPDYDPATGLGDRYFRTIDRFIKKSWSVGTSPVPEDIRDEVRRHCAPISSTSLIDDLYAALCNVYTTSLKPVLLPGAADMVRWTNNRWPVYLISDTYTVPGETLDRVLDIDGLLPMFRRRYYSDQFGVQKPNPRSLIDISTRDNLEQADIVHIGDLIEKDLGLAIQGGCHCMLLGEAASYKSAPPGDGRDDSLLAIRPSHGELKDVLNEY